MKKMLLLVSLGILGLVCGAAQDISRVSISINRDYFPKFRIHEEQFTGSEVYTAQLSIYDLDYTQLEYGLHYTRGYHQFISYSAGLSVAYVFWISDQFYIVIN